MDLILTTFAGREQERTHHETAFLIAFGIVPMDMDIGVNGGAT
ncbi:MAG: hypothetical protein OJF52_001395 [Nitrospira sp.]|nr:MAG: hypothetical protein OJF52_001395 [Nitrospira sp.]